MSTDPDLLAIWTRGWALTRGVAPPIWDHGGWRIDVGTADQIRRFVFADAGPSVALHAEAIVEPAILLKICAPPEAVRPLLPARWSTTHSGWMMTLVNVMVPAERPVHHYETRVFYEDAVAVCTLMDETGAEAARGRAVRAGDHVIYDQIVVDEAHRRRGLGGRVMRTLEAETGTTGLGLLVATDAGRALYETLGWRVHSPYTTALIPG